MSETDVKIAVLEQAHNDCKKATEKWQIEHERRAEAREARLISALSEFKKDIYSKMSAYEERLNKNDIKMALWVGGACTAYALITLFLQNYKVFFK